MTTYVCVMNRLNVDMHPISEMSPTSAAVEKSVKKLDMLTQKKIHNMREKQNWKLKLKAMSARNVFHPIIFTFSHLADAFIQSDLQLGVHKAINLEEANIQRKCQ